MPGGPGGFRQDSSCPALLGCQAQQASKLSVTGLSPSLAHPFHDASPSLEVSDLSRGPRPSPAWSHDPLAATLAGLARQRFRLFPVRSPLLRKSLLFSFPGATEMCHFAPLPLPALCVQAGVSRHDSGGVVPFGNLRINGCLRLTEAYRSLPRPSSSSYAKASTARP